MLSTIRNIIGSWRKSEKAGDQNVKFEMDGRKIVFHLGIARNTASLLQLGNESG